MKNIRNFAAMIFILCAVGAGCSAPAPQPTVQLPPHVDPVAIAKEIQSLDADWSHAANVGDVEKCISYYADDGVLLEPDSPRQRQGSFSKILDRASHRPELRQPHIRLNESNRRRSRRHGL